jgi:hypothetical protein
MTLPSSDPAVTPIDRGLRSFGRSVASRIVHEHPALVFTLAYVGLTALGMVYDIWFYHFFQIDILEYSETSDFVLAAIHNPIAVVISIIPIGMLLVGIRFREFLIRKSARYDAYQQKYTNTVWNSRPFKVTMAVILITTYAVVFTELYAAAIAGKLKRGGGTPVSISRINGDKPGEKPIVLGTTSRFLFLYYQARRETEIVPIDNISQVTVDSRMKKEREQPVAPHP